VEALQEIYVSQDVFAQQVRLDTTSFYQNALKQTSLPIQGADPVSNVWLRFDADVKLEDAAGDLGLSPDDLRNNLGLLDPVASVLRLGTLDRDDFTGIYLSSLCSLSALLENQPDANVCDDALRQIDDARRLR